MLSHMRRTLFSLFKVKVKKRYIIKVKKGYIIHIRVARGTSPVKIGRHRHPPQKPVLMIRPNVTQWHLSPPTPITFARPAYPAYSLMSRKPRLVSHKQEDCHFERSQTWTALQSEFRPKARHCFSLSCLIRRIECIKHFNDRRIECIKHFNDRRFECIKHFNDRA